jgi:hypothetical protein
MENLTRFWLREFAAGKVISQALPPRSAMKALSIARRLSVVSIRQQNDEGGKHLAGSQA